MPGGIGCPVLLFRYDLYIHIVRYILIDLVARRDLRCQPAAERHTDYETLYAQLMS